MVGVVGVGTCWDPYISSLNIQVASEIWEETRRFDEAVPVVSILARTKFFGNGLWKCCF